MSSFSHLVTNRQTDTHTHTERPRYFNTSISSSHLALLSVVIMRARKFS